MALNVIFMGTPAFSVPVLDSIVAAGHRILAVYSQPPRRAGRGMGEAKSPVQQRAEAIGLPVRTPVNFREEADREAFASLKADAAVVVAYGLVLPSAVLDATRLGCFNVHASKLPRWRGAAPIQRAIMAGDALTAVNIMQMDKGLDTGPVCLGEDLTIPAHMTAGELHDELSNLGARLMVDALAQLEAGVLKCSPQPQDGITYAAKIDKGETKIDFTRPSHEVVNHIRGLSPAPGAWCEMPIGQTAERIKVLRATATAGTGECATALDGRLLIACGQGAVRIEKLQRAGKQPMAGDEFLRGVAIPTGTKLA